MADQTVSHLVPFISLGGSIFSTVCTAYFWFVKANRERPKLTPFLIDHEFFLAEARGDTRTLGLNLHLAVANYSTLPNAVLGLDLQVKRLDGTWQALTKVTFDKQSPLPINLPPLQTALVRLTGRVSFPYQSELETRKDIEGSYLMKHLAMPLSLKLSVRGLQDKVGTTVVHGKSAAVAAAPGIKLAA